MPNRELEPAPYGFRVLPTAEAVSEARRHITSLVRRWPVEVTDEAIGNLALLADEVIANAIEYSGASCAVCVRWTGSRVRVEVTDGAAAIPRMKRAAPEEESGRGLLLIDSLSAAWGTLPDRAGKVVWFEVEAGMPVVDSPQSLPAQGFAPPLGGLRPLAELARVATQLWSDPVGMAVVSDRRRPTITRGGPRRRLVSSFLRSSWGES